MPPGYAATGVVVPERGRMDGVRESRRIAPNCEELRRSARRAERLELVGGVDAARERAVGEDLRLQLLRRRDRGAGRVDVGAAERVAVLGERPHRRVLDRRAVGFVARLWPAGGGHAGLADARRVALEVVGRLVVLARLVGQPVLLHVREDAADVAAVARAAAVAVDQHLRREDRVRVRALPRNLEPVVERGERAERPARAAVPD